MFHCGNKTGSQSIIMMCLLIFIFLTAGCTAKYPELSLEPQEEIDTVTAPTPHYHPQTPFSIGPEAPFIRLAVAPVVAPIQAREDFRGLLTYFPEQLGQPVDLVFRQTHAEINQLIRQDLVDIALVGSNSYLELEAGDDVELLAVPVINGHTYHHSLIIVPERSDFKTLEDLKGERFVFTDPLSFPGKLYTVKRLEELRETPGSFFSDHIYSYSHENSIIAVAEEWVTAASVCSMVYESLLEQNPELEDKIRILESSPPAGNPPLVVSSNIDSELKTKLKELFLTMHQSSRGIETLEGMRIDRFIPANEVDYDSLRSLLFGSAGDV